MLAKQLTTRCFGRTAFIKEEVRSTADIARKLIRQGFPEGTVVIAASQTRGRGKRGRAWFSPRGGGLWISIILRPRLKREEAQRLTALATDAVVNIIEKLTGIQAEVKPPNDVLINSRKVCGILTEILPGDRKRLSVVMGIGLNGNITENQWPAHLKNTATSLFLETGRRYSSLELAAALLEELEMLYFKRYE